MSYKCPFCEIFTYNFNDKMKNEERDKIMKEVSEHVNSHPECKTVKITEETTETATELTPPE